MARALDVLKGDVKLVLAHMGACEMYEDVYAFLAGRNVYFDTAYVLKEMGQDAFLRILEKHGADRILFASDSPWKDIAEMKKALQDLPLSVEDKEKIFYRNAEKLLAIQPTK